MNNNLIIQNSICRYIHNFYKIYTTICICKSLIRCVQLQVNGKNTCFGKFEYKDLDKAGELAEKMRKEIYRDYAGEN